MRQPTTPRRDPYRAILFAPPESVRLILDEEGAPAIDWQFQRTSAGFKFDRRAERKPDEAFEEFLALVGAPPDRVLRFVKRFGILTFSEQGQIRPLLNLTPGKAVNLFNPSEHMRGLKRPVPIQWYLDMAESFHGLRMLASRAWKGEPARAEEFAAVDPTYVEGVPAGKRVRPQQTWYLIERTVNSLLEAAGVRPVLVQGAAAPQRPEIEFIGHGLWGVLILQLMYSVIAADRLMICSECKRTYTLHPDQRRPRADRRNYCPSHSRDERRRVSSRESARLRRQLERAEKNA